MASGLPSRIAARVVGVLFVVCFLSHCGGRAPQQPGTTNQTISEKKNANACSLLSETEIAVLVGNPVSKGQIETSTDVCKWRTEDPSNVDVLLILREKGSTREQVLCDDLRKKASEGERVAGLGDIAAWKFSREVSLFNSGELEVCGPKGYLSLTLQGKREEAILKAAALSLTRKLLQRL